MAFPLRRRTIRAGWMLAAAVAGLQHGRAALPVRAEAELVSVANDYVLRVWETDDGLPQNTVTGIAQTPDGYLWLATQGGRFDGVRFTSYLKGTTPGLESSYARGVLSDRAGALWIGLERGDAHRSHRDQRPGRHGSFKLPAAEAQIRGLNAVLMDGADDTKQIGFWKDLGTPLAWTIHLPEAGKYRVEMQYSQLPADAGAKIAIAAGQQKVIARPVSSRRHAPHSARRRG